MSYLKDREIWLSSVPTDNPPAGYVWVFIQNGVFVVRDSNGLDKIMATTTGTVTNATSASYVEYSNVASKPALISGSSQVSYTGLSNTPAGIVSGSTQVSFNGIVDKPTLVSSSAQIVGYNVFATTGSNQFNGSQAVTGSLTVTGQVVAQTLNVQQVTSSIVYSSGSNIFGNSLGNTQQFTGSVSVTGSLAVAGALSGTSGTLTGALNGTSATFKVNADRNLAIKYDTNIALSAQADAGGPESLRVYADTFRIYTSTTAVGLTERFTVSNTGAATFSGTLAVNNEGIIINRGAGNGYLIFQTGGTDVGSIYSNTGGGIRLRNATSDVLTIDSTGAATFSESLAITKATSIFQLGNSTNNSYGAVQFLGNATGNGNTLGELDFFNKVTGVNTVSAQIEVIHEGSSGDNKSAMYFKTHNGTSLITPLTIASTGAATFTSDITSTSLSASIVAGRTTGYGYFGNLTGGAYSIVYGDSHATKPNRIEISGAGGVYILNAATFSSTVTLTTSSQPLIYLNTTSANQASAIITTESGTSKWAFGTNLGTGDNSFNIYNYAAAARYLAITSSGILTSLPTYNNTTGVAANVQIDANGYFARSTSSLKYKTDIRNYTKGLNEVLGLRPVFYKGKTDGDTQFAGLIAEEVHELGLTEFVQYAPDGSPDALSYQNMIALAFKAIQELKSENDNLKSRLEVLEQS